MTPTERRIILALLIGKLSCAELAQMLSLVVATVQRDVRYLRSTGLLYVARFEHRRTGAPRPHYTLSPKGQAAAKEFLSCQS